MCLEAGLELLILPSPALRAGIAGMGHHTCLAWHFFSNRNRKLREHASLRPLQVCVRISERGSEFGLSVIFWLLMPFDYQVLLSTYLTSKFVGSLRDSET